MEASSAGNHVMDNSTSGKSERPTLSREYAELRKRLLTQAETIDVEVDTEIDQFGKGRTHTHDDGDSLAVPAYAGPGKSNFLQTLLNSINVLAGVGILCTPYALSKVGWSGLTLLLVLACTGVYTAVLLRRCLDTDAALLTYPDVGHAAFGRAGRLLVSVVLYVDLYCVTVEFLIMLGDNLANLLPFAGFSLGIIRLTANQFYVVTSALIMLPTVWLRDLRLLAYVSAFGVAACVAIVGTVGYVGVADGVGFSNSGSLINLSGLPLAVGLLSFCFSGHAVFPSIYRSMKKPEDFVKVLIICFTLVTLIYGSMAILGYLMFGDGLESQVTLNLPKSFISSKIAIWITLVNPIAKYALTITPVAAAVEGYFLAGIDTTTTRFVCFGNVLRSLLVVSQVAVALLLPFFGFMMAFIGSLLACSVMILFPCSCYLFIYGPRRISSWEVALSFFVFILGILIATTGTYSAIRGMIDNY